MDIDIVVVNYRRYDLTQRFIDTFFQYESHHGLHTDYSLTVVDNGAEDLANPPRYPHEERVKVLSSKENLGYAKAVNWAASEGNAKYIGIFNNDVSFINPDCLDICIKFLENNPDVGVVGPRQIDSGGRITHAGIIGPGDQPKQRAWLQPDTGDYSENMEVLTVMGAAMVVRREAWEAVMADPVFRQHWPNALGAMPLHHLYFEETALNYMMPRLGYKVYYVGEAVCRHEWHQSINQFGDNNAFKESQALFRAMMSDMGILCD